MAITVYSEQEIFDQVIAYFRVQFPTKDLSEYSFLGLIARAVAQDLVLIQNAIEQADNDGTPAYDVDADGTIRSKTSPQALNFWAFCFGVSNGSGGYGRRGAVAASGGRATPTGVAGTLILIDSQATDANGTVVQTTSAVTLNGPPNTNAVSFVATTAGAAGNLTVGTLLTWVSPPPGLDSTLTLTQALTLGEDVESDSSLLSRILQRLQNPPKGGTAGDYRRWCEESVDISTGVTLGVSRAYVYPHRRGLGTVEMLITQAGTGAGRIPGNMVSVRNYVNTLRPVTATIYVNAPSTPAGQNLWIYCVVEPSLNRYNYDWDDDAIPGLATSVGTTSQYICANARANASLRNAVDQGLKPRIQIGVTNASATATPYVRRVTAYAIDAPAAGQTTLTLETALPYAAAIGDLMYAASPFVTPVAQAVLDYIDGLGPSRQSGYADTGDDWQDKVAIAQIVKTILNVKDTDGTAFIKNTDALYVDGVTISVGVYNAPSLNDYQPRDIFNAGPELAYCKPGSIFIIQKP